MGNKLKQYIPCAIISIPFVFWYFGAITSQDTYSTKLVTLGFISALHIAVSVLFHLMKKDFENFENKGQYIMKQEERQLLLKDLSARLPYNPMVHIHDPNTIDYDNYLYADYLDSMMSYSIRLKPYLRPMSSMTKEEEKEYRKTMDKYISNSDDFSKYTEYSWTIDTFDFLNAHHFDYRSLIPMGLAFEAPKDMYKL